MVAWVLSQALWILADLTLPQVEDCERLPPPHVCQLTRDWYRAHAGYCRAHSLSPLWLRAAVADQVADWYDVAEDAQRPGLSAWTRRRKLHWLRDRIGPEAYYAGRWP